MEFGSYQFCEINTTPLFTTYDEVVAYLTLIGSTNKIAVPLYKRGYAGDATKIIGHWRWTSDTVPAIAPVGKIRFDLVTDGGWGIVQSNNGPTTLTIAGGHTLPASFTARVFDITGGVELFDGVAGSMTVNTMTMPDTTGIAAGDLVYAIGRSELTIGGATRNIQPLTGCTKCNFDGVGLVVQNNAALIYLGSPFANYPMMYYQAEISYARSANADGQIAMVGVYATALKHVAAGLLRSGGSDQTSSSHSAIAAPTVVAPTAGGTFPITHVYSGVMPISTPSWAMGTLPPFRRSVPGTVMAETPVAFVVLPKPAGAETVTLTLKNLILV